MNNKEFGKELELRTREFAYEIIKLSSSLPKHTESLVVRNQLTKSGTSVGANYREANRTRSPQDFKNKIKICENEANETVYWLELISDLKWSESAILNKVIKEANELLAMFSSISNKLK